jgi:hypothetical protein
MDKRNIAAIIGVIAIIAITATAAYVGNNAGSDQINSTKFGQTVQIIDLEGRVVTVPTNMPKHCILSFSRIRI